MSLFTESSLCLVPSGVKEDKVYSIKPTDGSGDLTFSRGSDIEATRVASNGFIQKAAVNLLLQSNSFSTTWVPSNTTLTSGQSGYDGNSAWKVASTSGGTTDIQQNLSFSNIHTFSIYAKAGSIDFVKLFVVQSGTNRNCVIDLSDGSVASEVKANSSPETSVTSLADGWYRIEMPTNADSATFVRIRPQIAEGDDNLSVGDFIYIQDAQLNYGLVAQEYQETTTTSVVSGITNDLARLDYSGGASCPSLLLEGERRNLVADSEYYNSSNWNQGSIRGVINDNATTSPEGVLNASAYIPNSVYGRHYITETTFTATSGIDYTFSLFAKANGYNFVQIALSTGFDIVYQNFNLSTGALGNGDLSVGYEARIEPFGNGWYRISVTAETNTTSSSFLIVPISTDTTTRLPEYSGDSVNGILLYGAQREAGSYSTSYIPNYGLTSGATRTADVCNKTGISSLIGATEGTLFVEAKVTIGGRLMLIGTTGNFIEILTNATGKANGFVYNGSTQANILSTATYSSGDTLKIALAYKANDFALYVNGTSQGTDTSGAIPSSLAQLIINDYLSAGYNTANGYKQALLFKTRLSNADLATLTA